MNLEELNRAYMDLKSKLEAANKDIEKMRQDAQNLADDRTIQRGKEVEARRNGDKTAEENAQNEIKRIDTELEKIKEAATEKKKEIIDLQLKINEKIEEIKKDPEMKKHLEEVLSKKYDRKLSKLKDEREEVVGKKDRLVQLQKLVTDHPALGNNLKGILGAQKQITDLEAELESLKDTTVPGGLVSYKDPARANEILTKELPGAQSRLNSNKTTLMSYITKNSLGITEQDIDELAAKGFVVDSKGYIDLNATMNKSISGLNRQIKGYDKSIRDHEIALENLGRTPATKAAPTPAAKTATKPTPTVEEEEVEEEPLKWYQKLAQGFKNWLNKGDEEEEVEEEVESEEKPKQKWYQRLIQGFKNLTAKKAAALPEPGRTEPETSAKPEATKGTFRDSMKYDIVKDIVEQMETDNRRAAKQERKAETKGDGESR